MTNFLDGEVFAKFDGAAATIEASTGGIASIVRTGAGDYLITRGASTGGWDTDATVCFVTVEGLVPLVSVVTRVSDDAINVAFVTAAGAAADCTFGFMVRKIR